MTQRILVADTPEGDRRISAILSGYDLVLVRTLGEAQRILRREKFALVLVGVHFDDSRMFDLVRVLRGDELHAGVPIVCVRGRPGFTAVTGRTLELTLKALTADEFIDLVHFGDDEAGNAALRAAVERLLRA